MKFCCSVCEYMTDIKANYNKHLLSQKHKLKVENSQVKCSDTKSISGALASQPKVNPESTQSQPMGNPESTSLFVCHYCEQQFKFKQSMYRHIKYSCTKNKTEDLAELVRLLNLQIEQQRNDFQSQLQTQTKHIETQQKQIDKLMGKLEINGSFNTTINMNLLNYNETDTSHLTDEDYRKCIRNASRCVLRLIEKVHFNPNKPENMNLYISNMKDKYMMMYKDNKWMLTDKAQLGSVYDDKEEMIEEWFAENKDSEMIKYFNRYLNLKEDDKEMQLIKEEMKLMMFNNKNLIKD
jgi:hypothetical protein